MYVYNNEAILLRAAKLSVWQKNDNLQAMFPKVDAGNSSSET